MRRTLALVATVTATLVLGQAPSLAGDRANSAVTVTTAKVVSDGVLVKGKVTSAQDSCTKRRKVKVFHDVAPQGPSEQDFLLGTVRTNRYGRWKLTTPYAPDKVYAVVKATDACEGDTSPTKAVAN